MDSSEEDLLERRKHVAQTTANGVVMRPSFAFVLMVEMLRRKAQLPGLDAVAFRDWLYGPSWDNLFRFLAPVEAAIVKRALKITEPQQTSQYLRPPHYRTPIDAKRFEEVITAPLIGRYMPKTLWWHFITGGTMRRQFFGEILRIAHNLSIIDTAWILRELGDGDEETGIQFLLTRFTPAERHLLLQELHTDDGSFQGIVVRHWRLLLTKMSEEDVRTLMRVLGTHVGFCCVNAELEEELRAAEYDGAMTIRAPQLPRITAPIDTCIRQSDDEP